MVDKAKKKNNLQYLSIVIVFNELKSKFMKSFFLYYFKLLSHVDLNSWSVIEPQTIASQFLFKILLYLFFYLYFCSVLYSSFFFSSLRFYLPRRCFPSCIGSSSIGKRSNPFSILLIYFPVHFKGFNSPKIFPNIFFMVRVEDFVQRQTIKDSLFFFFQFSFFLRFSFTKLKIFLFNLL